MTVKSIIDLPNERQMAKAGIGMYYLYHYCGRYCLADKTILKFFVMKLNMGNADRIIRLIVAAVFAYLYFSSTVTGTIGLVLLVLGGVFALTSIVGYCPLYSIVGINTCKTKSNG